MRIVLLTALALALGLPSAQAAQVVLQPGQSIDAACDAAAPGDTIQLAAGSWPSQSLSCFKAAPGVVIMPAPGANAELARLSITGSHLTVRGVRTSMLAPL